MYTSSTTQIEQNIYFSFNTGGIKFADHIKIYKSVVSVFVIITISAYYKKIINPCVCTTMVYLKL